MLEQWRCVLNRIARILCPIDFSEFSRHALDHAVAVARWHEARVTVLHVGAPPVPASESPFAGYASLPLPPPVDTEVLVSEVRRFWDAAAAESIPPDIAVRHGSPVHEIVDLAERLPADLLVMGTHGRSGFERLYLGSVTERVVRKARCPVLTVPPRLQDAGKGPASYKTILCPVDFGPSSLRALDYALALAKEADARLILLHVLEPQIEEARLGEIAHFSVPEYYRYVKNDARTRLQSIIPEEARTWCSPEHRLVSGKPHREILSVAAEAAADLIVMGVQGRGAVSVAVIGSTTNHVLRGAVCPVLTVKT